jgi:hypothetical protein
MGGGWLGAIAMCSALLPASANGQSAKEITQQTQFWWSLNSTLRVTNRWGVIGDFHIRRNDFVREPSFYLLRFGAHYWVTEKLTLSLGYAHMWQAPSCEACETWSNENRVYQQVQYATTLGRARVLHRVRNEQRFKQTVEDDVLTGKTAFSDRVRFLASFTIPVSQDRSGLALVLSDEVLLQFGTGIVVNTFDQNRLFAGVKKQLSRSWGFDLGYMLVYQQKPTGFQYDLNHTVRWFWYWTPDRRKVKAAHETAGNEE